MQLQGKNMISGRPTGAGTATFQAVAPATGEKLAPQFFDATGADVNAACSAAAEAFEDYRTRSPDQIAAFLDRITEEITRLGGDLIRRANLETALPEARLTGERARTVNQIKMFADLVREGSWVEACIDRAIPNRQPVPKPLLKRMLVPIGPVAVFGASNFPLAFSVAGGDTISALAAGNPVVIKAHPAHPGTSEMAGRAIHAAAEAMGFPAGIFSLLHGQGHEVGLQLVRHPAIKSVGFTGSLQAGRALFDAAAARPQPIPVYAEMGSTNPVFVLPGAIHQNPGALAEGLFQSVTLGVGQFCTKPGLVFGLRCEGWKALEQAAGNLAAASTPGTMLYSAIAERFRQSAVLVEKTPGVRVLGASGQQFSNGKAAATVFATDAENFQRTEYLHDELFGPATILVSCASAAELEAMARRMPGQLTATIHGTEEDLREHQRLVQILQQKVGRLIFNGFPTGVEVCPSMHHGGPYPATTGAHFTSVGSAAIKRFARPVCFQNFPDAGLPPELQNQNSRKIWRLVDGQLTREDL